ncbi:MAG: HAMP domain-containing sensor histidine kinase, partial [Eubacteriales bacterium]
SYTVVVDLKLVFRLLGVIWNLMLFWQGISIFINILGTTKSIQRTLRPIQELTATTMRLHATKDPTKIEMAALTGALEKISAIDLDSRISLTETQRELQPLAQAINAMLDRVSQSYEVQMRFVSDASHELRTPIAVIKGYSDMLDRWGKSDSDALQEGIDAIHSESRSMERLVEQLLFLARGDNLSQPVKKESIDLTELAAQIIREERIRNPSREITTSWTSPLITVADPTLIKQVLRILMDNSMKYSKDRIWFTLKHTESTIIISLEDEGMGIPTDSIPHIFDRFYRSDRSRTRQTGGTGLGLSIALWIAEQHNGWFTVISREGIGTKLSLHLPFSPTELPKTI